MTTLLLILLASLFLTGFVGSIYFACVSRSFTWMILSQRNAAVCLEAFLAVLGGIFSANNS